LFFFADFRKNAPISDVGRVERQRNPPRSVPSLPIVAYRAAESAALSIPSPFIPKWRVPPLALHPPYIRVPKQSMGTGEKPDFFAPPTGPRVLAESEVRTILQIVPQSWIERVEDNVRNSDDCWQGTAFL